MSSGPDGGLRKMLMGHLTPADGWAWSALEVTSGERGIPDAAYCCAGVSGWVECKAGETARVPVSGSLGFQLNWTRRWCAAGARVTWAVRQQHNGGPRRGAALDRLWLLDGAAIAALAGNGLAVDAGGVLLVTDGGVRGWDWKAIAHTLTRRVGD